MLKFNVSVLNKLKIMALRQKCPKTELNLNTGKHGAEKTPNLNTFHALWDSL